jgi:hypothetical protein
MEVGIRFTLMPMRVSADMHTSASSSKFEQTALLCLLNAPLTPCSNKLRRILALTAAIWRYDITS